MYIRALPIAAHHQVPHSGIQNQLLEQRREIPVGHWVHQYCRGESEDIPLQPIHLLHAIEEVYI